MHVERRHASRQNTNTQNHPGGTGFDGTKASKREVEAWHQGRTVEAIGEGATSVTLLY